MSQVETLPLSFLNVMGLGNAGKSAMVDLLREVEGVFVPKQRPLGPFEFNLIRMPGGLLDLHTHLCTNWSPIRSDSAIKCFRKLVRAIGEDPHYYNIPGMIRTDGHRYNQHFNGKFIDLSLEFVDKFVIGKYESLSPYGAIYDDPMERFFRRLLGRVRRGATASQESLIVDGEGFKRELNIYLNKLFRECVVNGETDVVWCNAVEPYDGSRAHDLIDNLKSVVLRRDPRDVYVSGLNASNTSKDDRALWGVENNGFTRKFLATDDIELFVKKYELGEKKIVENTISENMKIIRFEELVLKYDVLVPELLDFLRLDLSRHRQARRYFDPSRSRKNVGLWRSYSKKQEINFIESRLGQYCYE